jgi:membrane protein DedA with SNARE-associated domain
MSHAFPLSCPDIEGLRRVRETKRGGWMRRFLSGALPFYALAGLAMCMYLVLYKTNLFDLNAIVQDATGSAWFPVFMFACVLLESVFPYFGYFPGTALILMSVALNPKPADVSVFIVAWAAIVVGAVLSYGQARFFRPMLQRVASKAALSRCESLLDSYGPYARVALFVHPNACAMYFTALGLLGRNLTRELAYLSVGAAASVGILFVVVTRLVSSAGATDDGELQVLLAAGLVAIGTLVGLYAALRPDRAA